MRPAQKMEEGARKGLDSAEDWDICMRISVQRFYEEREWKRASRIQYMQTCMYQMRWSIFSRASQGSCGIHETPGEG
jgi:hypothetical protein